MRVHKPLSPTWHESQVLYGTLSKVLFSILPLTEESVGNHPYQVPEALMLPFREGLGKDINNLVISRNKLQLHRSSLSDIMQSMIYYTYNVPQHMLCDDPLGSHE